MKKNKGWTKGWRERWDHDISEDDAAFKMFHWCIDKASFANTSFIIMHNNSVKKITLKKGQFITGRFQGSKELRWSSSKFSRVIKKLQETYDVIETKDAGFGTIITVKNYEKYQGNGN